MMNPKTGQRLNADLDALCQNKVYMNGVTAMTALRV
jgi:hypothetical protein